MAVTNGYCTTLDLRAHLAGGAISDKLDEQALDRAINATSRAIDRFCGRKFWLDDSPTVRRYVTDDTEVVFIADIGSTTGLIIATDSSGDGTYATVWSSSDYELRPLDADQLGEPYSWTQIVAVDTKRFITGTRRASLRVTARHGWSEVPDDVHQACLIRAAAIFQRQAAVYGIAGLSEMGSVVRIGRQDPDVIALLHPYVRMTVRAV